MSKKSIIISVIVALVVAVSITIYLTIKSSKGKQLNGGNSSKWANVAAEQTTFPLTKGSTGKAVKVVQTITGVNVDGVFGDQTKGGVISYYGSSKPNVSKDDFKLMVSNQIGFINDATKLLPKDGYFYQIATILADGEPGDITYQDYIDLVNKVFDLGLQPSDFN